ncbi:MAG: hypothetical protein M3134_02130 [Actinomycetota bacterium]|nr:hypothetical protein [Actinomycetota bacterium]
MNERSLVLWIGGGLVVATALAVVAYLVLGGGDDGDAGEGSAAPGGNAASSLEGGPDEVLYLSGTALVRRNLENDKEKAVGTIETPSVYASPGSQWVAYVTSEKVKDDDFAAEPVLHLYDPETGDESDHGPGVAPVWNATGTHVAFLRPVEPRDCQGETCAGDVQIGVVEAGSDADATLLLDAGKYSILGWAGEWVLVSDFEDPTQVIAVNLDDDRTVLGMPASQFWDASPDGRWIVKTNAKKTELVSWDGDELAEERVAVDLGDYQLLEGAWAHDSSRVAAVVGLPGRRGMQETRVVTFSPEDPELVEVADSFGATGTVMWAVDNEAVVFASLLDPKRALFQAKSCALGNESTCEVVTSWTEGVALLRTE